MIFGEEYAPASVEMPSAGTLAIHDRAMSNKPCPFAYWQWRLEQQAPLVHLGTLALEAARAECAMKEAHGKGEAAWRAATLAYHKAQDAFSAAVRGMVETEAA